MNLDDLQSVLEPLNLTSLKQRTNWVIASCPLAPWRHSSGADSNPSFGITIKEDSGVFATCYSCKFHGTMDEFLTDLHLLNREHQQYPSTAVSAAYKKWLDVEDDATWQAIDYEQQLMQPKKRVTVYFNETWLDLFTSTPNHPYLAARGVSGPVGALLDCRHDFSRDRICFPYRAFNGKLVGMQGRDITNNQEPRYYQYSCEGRYNPHVWMNEQHINPSKPVVLVEGPFDLCKVVPTTLNVLASMGPVTHAKLERLKHIERLITFFDAGSGGDENRKIVEKSAGERVIGQMLLTAPDPGAMNDDAVKAAYINVLSDQTEKGNDP